MRHLRGQTSLLSDCDCFFNTRDYATRFVAHVRDVNPAESAGDFRKFDDLFGRRESSWNVEQAGTQPQGTVFHTLLNKRLHPAEFFVCRAAVYVSDDSRAHRALTDEGADVDRFRQSLQLREEWSKRYGRIAIRTFDDSRDALTDVIVGCGYLEDSSASVAVNINEARRNHLASNIDDVGGSVGNGWRNPDDGISADTNIGVVPGATRAIDNAAVSKHQVVRCILGRQERC